MPEKKKEQKKQGLACLFPGIGYTCDKPLLYYSWKLLKGLSWEVVPVPYSGFPEKVRGDAEKMNRCAQIARDQRHHVGKAASGGGNAPGNRLEPV